MDRYKHGKRKTVATKSAIKLPNRPSKRKQWSEQQMLAAIDVAQDGITKSINKAALEYSVLASILKNRISGHVVHGTKPGPVPYLSAKEEDNLKQYLVEACHIGYGKMRSRAKGIVENVAIVKGILCSPRVSNGWWRRFLERNPRLVEMIS